MQSEAATSLMQDASTLKKLCLSMLKSPKRILKQFTRRLNQFNKPSSKRWQDMMRNLLQALMSLRHVSYHRVVSKDVNHRSRTRRICRILPTLPMTSSNHLLTMIHFWYFERTDLHHRKCWGFIGGHFAILFAVDIHLYASNLSDHSCRRLESSPRDIG